MKSSSLFIALCSLLLTGSTGLIAGCRKESSFLNESEKAQRPRTELIQKNDAISNSRQTAITETVRIASPAIVGIS
ncbi:MAG: hypothetical protein ACK49C_00430, partial [Ignavibacteria bacterium]